MEKKVIAIYISSDLFTRYKAYCKSNGLFLAKKTLKLILENINKNLSIVNNEFESAHYSKKKLIKLIANIDDYNFIMNNKSDEQSLSRWVELLIYNYLK